MPTLRFADARTVPHYPFEISTAADWQAADGAWRVTVPLPDLPVRTIMAPSLSILNDPDCRFQFTLRVGEQHYHLPPIPAASTTHEEDPSDRRVRTAIDCFHTIKEGRDVALIVTLSARQMPERYLLTISMRPEEIDPERTPTPEVRAPAPPTHSQMLENPRIAARICSPVSTAMVLALHCPSVDYHQVIDACFDPVTRMYGMWPLAIRAAGQHGCLGAVELLRDWAPVVACLERGLPVVASIRYGPGELPGAAQHATGGHLVVVHGITDGGRTVLMNDPAAPNHGSVQRRCPLDAFSRAWFRYRGAAYILTP